MKKPSFIAAILTLLIVLTPLVAMAEADQESVVVGRIAGTRQPLPGYFFRNTSLANQQIFEVEFIGFRIANRESGKRYSIRPNRQGYFYEQLPPGRYELMRSRTDRPRYAGDKTVSILPFEVPAGTLVNIGSLGLVLDGEVEEYLIPSGWGFEGTYTYRYHYERRQGDRAQADPLTWFRWKKSRLADRFGDRVAVVDAPPADTSDSSEIVLKERRRD